MIRKSCEGCKSITELHITSPYPREKTLVQITCSEIKHLSYRVYIPRCPCRVCLVKVTCNKKCDLFNKSYRDALNIIYKARVRK